MLQVCLVHDGKVAAMSRFFVAGSNVSKLPETATHSRVLLQRMHQTSGQTGPGDRIRKKKPCKSSQQWTCPASQIHFWSRTRPYYRFKACLQSTPQNNTIWCQPPIPASGLEEAPKRFLKQRQIDSNWQVSSVSSSKFSSFQLADPLPPQCQVLDRHLEPPKHIQQRMWLALHDANSSFSKTNYDILWLNSEIN